MADVAIEAQERMELGKEKVKKLRNQGKLIANVYGKGEESMSLVMDYIEIYKHLTTGNGRNTVFNIKTQNKTFHAIPYEIQLHPLTKALVHVDFKKVKEDEKVKVRLPIRSSGVSIGAKKGGTFEQKLHVLTVKILPKDISKELLVDISTLDINGVITVKDLPLPPSAETVKMLLTQKVFIVLPPK